MIEFKDKVDAMNAVETINKELYVSYKKLGFELVPILSVTYASYIMLIELTIPTINGLKIPLYNSESDDRIFSSKTNSYESYYKYIKRKWKELKLNINKVKI